MFTRSIKSIEQAPRREQWARELDVLIYGLYRKSWNLGPNQLADAWNKKDIIEKIDSSIVHSLARLLLQAQDCKQQQFWQRGKFTKDFYSKIEIWVSN